MKANRVGSADIALAQRCAKRINEVRERQGLTPIYAKIGRKGEIISAKSARRTVKEQNPRVRAQLRRKRAGFKTADDLVYELIAGADAPVMFAEIAQKLEHAEGTLRSAVNRLCERGRVVKFKDFGFTDTGGAVLFYAPADQVTERRARYREIVDALIAAGDAPITHTVVDILSRNPDGMTIGQIRPQTDRSFEQIRKALEHMEMIGRATATKNASGARVWRLVLG